MPNFPAQLELTKTEIPYMRASLSFEISKLKCGTEVTSSDFSPVSFQFNDRYNISKCIKSLFRAAKHLHIKAIQSTDELRQQFVSLLGSVVQGGSMISGHDNRCISDLFYSPGGMLRNNTPLEVRLKIVNVLLMFCALFKKNVPDHRQYALLFSQIIHHKVPLFQGDRLFSCSQFNLLKFWRKQGNFLIDCNFLHYLCCVFVACPSKFA